MNGITHEALPAPWDVALEAARRAAQQGEVPIGAVLFWPAHPEWGVVAAGNVREAEHDPTGHAEIVALRRAAQARGSWRLNGAVMCVTLEPCPMCLAALQQARVERVEFAAWDVKGGAVSLGYRLFEDVRLSHCLEVQHVPHGEAAVLLREFFEARRMR